MLSIAIAIVSLQFLTLFQDSHSHVFAHFPFPARNPAMPLPSRQAVAVSHEFSTSTFIHAADTVVRVTWD